MQDFPCTNIIRLHVATRVRTLPLKYAHIPILQLTLVTYLEALVDWVTSVTFSHNGRMVVSASLDKTVWIWDAETSALQRTLEDYTDSRQWFSLTAAGGWRLHHWTRQLDSGVLRLASYNRRSGGYTTWVTSVADETVRLWDTKTGALKQMLKCHTGRVSSVTFSHDGQRVVSASFDGTARLCDAETGALQQTLDIGNITNTTLFSFVDLNLITELCWITISQSPVSSFQPPTWTAYSIH